VKKLLSAIPADRRHACAFLRSRLETEKTYNSVMMLVIPNGAEPISVDGATSANHSIGRIPETLGVRKVKYLVATAAVRIVEALETVHPD
jgi:hypothetical protein